MVTCKRSLRSWRDCGPECFCFGSEAVNNAVNTSSEVVRGLVKSRVQFPHANSFASPVREYGGSVARPVTNPASYAG